MLTDFLLRYKNLPFYELLFADSVGHILWMTELTTPEEEEVASDKIK